MVTWIRRAHFDPLREIGDHLVRQLRAILGHFLPFDLVPNDFQQATRRGTLGLHRQPRITSPQQRCPMIESQSSLGGIQAVVALVAPLDKYRSNALFKELDAPFLGRNDPSRTHRPGEEDTTNELLWVGSHHCGFDRSRDDLWTRRSQSGSYSINIRAQSFTVNYKCFRHGPTGLTCEAKSAACSKSVT